MFIAGWGAVRFNGPTSNTLLQVVIIVIVIVIVIIVIIVIIIIIIIIITIEVCHWMTEVASSAELCLLCERFEVSARIKCLILHHHHERKE